MVAKFTDANGQGLAVKKIEKVFNCKNDDYAALMEVRHSLWNRCVPPRLDSRGMERESG